MYFDEGRCAHCHKKLPHLYEQEEYNKSGPPFLCSAKCHDIIGRVREWEPEYQEPEINESHEYIYGHYNAAYEELSKRERDRVAFAHKMIGYNHLDFRQKWRSVKEDLDQQAEADRIAAEMAKPKMPDTIPYRIRNEHQHVVAGSGSGKTSMLTYDAMVDVFDERQPALIVLDGKGTWAPALQRFACFAPERKQSERLIIINPQDKEPAALNMFAAGDQSLIDGVSEDLAYIFGSRDYELSAKMRTAFTYAAQLLFALENPTIETLLALMRDPIADPKTGGIKPDSPFRRAVEQQPPINQRFFYELFYHPTEFLETKRQIQNRIYDLLSCRAFSAMFMQEENRLDMHDVMQTGKILIVDASPGAVGEKAASSFGRYIISLALSTARARINIPRDQWRQTFLYIDEAQMFVDEERTQPLLQQAREFNLGVILAHQKLADLTPKLRAAFAANTALKYCANPAADDARDMAKEMRTDAQFILSQGHRDGYAHFAAYIRGMTECAVSRRFKLGIIDDTARMTDAQYAELMCRNRVLMSPRQRAKPQEPLAVPAPPPRPPSSPAKVVEKMPAFETAAVADDDSDDFA